MTEEPHFSDGLWRPRIASFVAEHAQRDSEVALPFVHKKRRTVIQAGGYIGLWPIALARHFQHVITFEPHPLNFECLKLNIEGKPNYKRITAYPYALGERDGSCAIDEDIKNSSRTQVSPVAGGDFYMRTIDSLGLDDVDFICLDVESHEFPVLKGAWHTLQRCKPVVLVECSGPRPRDGSKHNYADIALMLEGWEQKARVGRDVVLQWTGTKQRLAFLGKPPPVPSGPQYRGPHET